MIVAVRREMIDRLVSATREAGLKLEGIDLAAFGMVRALAPVAAGGQRGALHQRRRAHQRRRRQPLRLPVHPRRRRRPRARSPATLAERALAHARARAPVDAATSASLTPLEEIEGEAELVAATRAALEEGVHQLADTVRNSLNFYRMQDNAETVERALLTGPAVAIPGFAERLADELKLPVEPAVVGVDDAAAPTARADSGRLTVAAGLAVEDR